jgi:ribulose-phosphate 3-epimerase
MIDICPTITVNNSDDYQHYIERIALFAVRIHIDLADGTLTENKLINPDLIWWPGGVRADIHIMYKYPDRHLPLIMDLRPQLIIVHAEADGDFNWLANTLHNNGMEVGVALLADTPANVLFESISLIDHVLIFSGNLGSYGGQANLSLLDKVHQLKTIKPQLEIGWDGGINESNTLALVNGGIDVLNVGKYLQQAESIEEAYARLEKVVKGNNTVNNDG